LTGLLPIAVIGAGMMARRRLAALMATGRVRLCGVVARRLSSAQALAETFGGAPAFDDDRALAEVAPAAVLLEVPHNVQDAIALRVILQGWHLLIGGPLATSTAMGRTLDSAARARGVIVEAGFEARYKPVWETARHVCRTGALGRIVAVSGVALWDGDPASWYYDEAISGGMPLTHMSYCFVNPLRWLLGEPTRVAAFANRLVHTDESLVREETVVATLRFPRDMLATLTAGYVKSTDTGTWQVTLYGSAATLEITPGEMDAGSLRLLRGTTADALPIAATENGFRRQADAFLDAIAGGEPGRNAPGDCLGDLRVVEAIRESVRQGVIVRL